MEAVFHGPNSKDVLEAVEESIDDLMHEARTETEEPLHGSVPMGWRRREDESLPL